ncbi:uncharacterized protein LOC6558796 [Drosophila grimshawi]|uniref:GH15871 n=1 Tax=Drosophila grimshawi TaxID=7222 RepID=B4J0D7_DROGR|nr:uncharacterized protein LOC6558796 [Drosophila grimshawi]EDV95738.1 GH15871 [Drosophila grimshawi]
MFKVLFVLFLALVASSHSRPSYLPAYETIEYAPTVLGYEHLGLPTAISHQSSTVVHEKRPYLRPIYEHHHTPLLKSYHHPTTYSYASSPLNYGSEWYEPGWTGGLSYSPSIYLK